MLYHATDSAVVYDAGSPAQSDWANKISKAVNPALALRPKQGLSSDSLSVIVCEGAKPETHFTTVYVQVASREQLHRAKALRSNLERETTATSIPDHIEVVRDSPPETQVRYFLPAQAGEASNIAERVSALLNHPVGAILVPGHEKKVGKSPWIELWLGKDEPVE
jgi:hypothetical protein